MSDSTAPSTVRTLTEADLEATDRVLKAAYRRAALRVARLRSGRRRVLCTRDGHAAAAVRPEAAIPLDERDLERIVSLDAPIFGADRGRLLALMLAAYRGRAFGVLDRSGELSGFVIAQERRIGP